MNRSSCDIKRRDVFDSTLFSATILAGCLGRGGETNGDFENGGSTDNPAFERCENRIVSVSRLPDDAETKVRAAMEEGEHSTEGERILEKVIDPDRTCLAHGERYHRVTIETGEERARLRFEKSPPFFSEEVVLENQLAHVVAVTIRLHYEESDTIVLPRALYVGGGWKRSHRALAPPTTGSTDMLREEFEQRFDFLEGIAAIDHPRISIPFNEPVFGEFWQVNVAELDLRDGSIPKFRFELAHRKGRFWPDVLVL